jgi:hypothetical protein
MSIHYEADWNTDPKPKAFDHSHDKSSHPGRVRSSDDSLLDVCCESCGIRMCAECFSRCLNNGNDERAILIMRCPGCRQTGMVQLRRYESNGGGAAVSPCLLPGQEDITYAVCPVDRSVATELAYFGYEYKAGGDLLIHCGYLGGCNHVFTLIAETGKVFSHAPHIHPHQ